jgi:hypothetical protein
MIQSRCPYSDEYMMGNAVIYLVDSPKLLTQRTKNSNYHRIYIVYEGENIVKIFEIMNYISLFSVILLKGSCNIYDKKNILLLLKRLVSGGISSEVVRNVNYQVSFYLQQKIENLDGIQATKFYVKNNISNQKSYSETTTHTFAMDYIEYKHYEYRTNLT